MIASDGVDQIINKPLPGFEELRMVFNQIIEAKKASNQRG
jgi:hypothetical protein